MTSKIVCKFHPNLAISFSIRTEKICENLWVDSEDRNNDSISAAAQPYSIDIERSMQIHSELGFLLSIEQPGCKCTYCILF